MNAYVGGINIRVCPITHEAKLTNKIGKEYTIVPPSFKNESELVLWTLCNELVVGESKDGEV